MRITLIALYDLHSYGIRGLHSKLAKEGHKVKSVYFKYGTYTSSAYTGQQIDDLMNCVKETKPDLVGVSLKSPVLNLFKIIAERVKKEIGCKILVGGPHAISVPDTMTEYADEVCRGDVEIPENLDEWEFPYYGKDALYVHSKEEIIDTISIFGSRGCLFNCTYCFENVARKQISGYHLRRKSVDRMIEESLRLQNLFGPLEEMVFSDCVFTHNNDWLEEFYSKWPRTKMQFRCFGHLSLISKEMINNLKATGLKWLSFGIESASDEIRRIFGRRQKNERIFEVSKWCKDAGIIPRWDFIICNPYDTAISQRETWDMFFQLERPCVIREFKLRFYPNTDITNRALHEGKIVSNDIEGSVDKLGQWHHSYILC